MDLVQTNGSFSENCEPILQTPRGPAYIGILPRTLVTAKRCRFESRFLREPGGKCNLEGAGRKSWLSRQVGVGLRGI